MEAVESEMDIFWSLLLKSPCFIVEGRVISSVSVSVSVSISTVISRFLCEGLDCGMVSLISLFFMFCRGRQWRVEGFDFSLLDGCVFPLFKLGTGVFSAVSES